MNRDDFNMYLAGSFFATKEGDLIFIEECDDDDNVHCVVYDTEHDTYSMTIDIEGIEDTLDFNGFDLKPFEVDGLAYSPSYSSMRGIKDGVNNRRITLAPMGHTRSRDCSRKDIVRMYFDPIGTVEDALNVISSGQKRYCSIGDGFYLARQVSTEEDKEPFCSVRVTMTDEGDLRVVSEDFDAILSSFSPCSPLPSDSSVQQQKGFTSIKTLGEWLEDKIGSPPGTVPTVVIEHYMEWAGRNLNETPRLELSRHGMPLCVLGEEIPEFFKGLPKLNNYIEALTNEFTSVAMRNRA